MCVCGGKLITVVINAQPLILSRSLREAASADVAARNIAFCAGTERLKSENEKRVDFNYHASARERRRSLLVVLITPCVLISEIRHSLAYRRPRSDLWLSNFSIRGVIYLVYLCVCAQNSL